MLWRIELKPCSQRFMLTRSAHHSNLTIRHDLTAEHFCNNGSPNQIFLSFHVVVQVLRGAILTATLWLIANGYLVEITLVISRIDCCEFYGVSVSLDGFELDNDHLSSFELSHFRPL